MPSDTPRTDALVRRAYNLIDEHTLAVPAHLCRELERELTATLVDKARLDSRKIRLVHRDEFGNEVPTVHTNIDLRAAIDAAR